ncbi:MAG: hypothetical protein ACI9TH_000849 [Kiritimatiellia bacterium]|jgi:hypothetical protein
MILRPIALLLAFTTSSIGFGESLFDGKSLSLWEAKGTAEWRAENGVIVGGQDGDPKRSGVLRTKQTFADFDFETEFMIDEHGKYNSGVYLRDTGNGKRYQVNIGRGVAGEYVGLHCGDWLDKGDEADAIRKPNAWNHLRIRAVGPKIEVWLNQQPIVNYTEPKPTPENLAPGALSLQTYGAEGHAGWVKFRGLKVTDLGQPTDGK